jgi:hypothetical protein
MSDVRVTVLSQDEESEYSFRSRVEAAVERAIKRMKPNTYNHQYLVQITITKIEEVTDSDDEVEDEDD